MDQHHPPTAPTSPALTADLLYHHNRQQQAQYGYQTESIDAFTEKGVYVRQQLQQQQQQQYQQLLQQQQYAQRTQRGSKGSARSRAHDSVISNPLSPKPSTPPSPTSSIRSTHSPHRQSYIQPSVKEVIQSPKRAHLDPEKAYAPTRSDRTPTRISGSHADATPPVIYSAGQFREKGPEEKPLALLLYLSGPCALLSFFITLWTLVALIISILLQPFRLFTSRSTLPTQLTTFLAPPLNLQLHLIYSFNTSETYSAPMLVMIHLLAPFIAIGVALAAWTAACFWFFSAILGDPAGKDGHNDGKESILGVRNWWDRWLSRALR